MENIIENLPFVLGFLFIGAAWFIYRRAVTDRLNNAENHRDDLLDVLREIRDELKELNRNNSIK